MRLWMFFLRCLWATRLLIVIIEKNSEWNPFCNIRITLLKYIHTHTYLLFLIRNHNFLTQYYKLGKLICIWKLRGWHFKNVTVKCNFSIVNGFFALITLGNIFYLLYLYYKQSIHDISINKFLKVPLLVVQEQRTPNRNKNHSDHIKACWITFVRISIIRFSVI